jgi:hypothetical protein
MRLSDLPGLLLSDIVGKWRRRIIAGGVITICVIGVVVEGFSAARHALEQSFGPVWARLILAGIFLAAIVATVAVLYLLERRKADATAAVKNDERTVLIAEALSLGYTLAQEFSKRPSRPPDESLDEPLHQNGVAPDERSAA